MDEPVSPHPTGRRLRRRVRILTVGITGTAIMATVGVTAVLAAEPAATTSTASVSTSNLSADDGSSAGTGTRSGSLDAPGQAPFAAAGAGHASSGGS